MIADNRVLGTRMIEPAVFEIRPAFHQATIEFIAGIGEEAMRGKRQKLPDRGCKGPQINRGKNKHRDRY